MPMEGDPSSLAKVAQLFILSLAWGMQIWVTFISGFVLIRNVSRHTFGLVQSKLFPFYFSALVVCAFLNLCIFACYHPRELLSTWETLQGMLYFVCLLLASVNGLGFSRATTAAMFRMHAIEREHGLGGEVGLAARREAYQQLRERDPKYRDARQIFFKHHGLSSFCNLVCLTCSAFNLLCLALHLSSL
ncbi:transmembrane protein 205 [Emydura macquarii macquarii]|uniref:transmembrane protein 205 n=1 Tax=Emydura macquarii macquarii TaxID=1129001 RepID=UPI00352A5C94